MCMGIIFCGGTFLPSQGDRQRAPLASPRLPPFPSAPRLNHTPATSRVDKTLEPIILRVMNPIRHVGAGALVLFLMAGNALADWPAWRGPTGQGIVNEKQVPSKWSATENVRWKIPLPDRGNSTPAIWGDKVFVTQAIEKDHQRSLLCFSRRDGKLLWEKSVKYDQKEESHETNPYCSASPVTDGERVIVSHASAGLWCYDLNGKELWHRDLGRQEFEWGNGSSPVIHGDVCFIYHGPGKGAYLAALDKKTGRTVWKYDEPPVDVGKRTDGFRGREPGIICTYSTPIIVRAGDREELIMSFPRYLRAFHPGSGKELWHADGLNPLIYTSPIYGDGVVVAMGGFFGNTIAVKPGGNGDVTASHRLWRAERTRSGIGSGVIYQGHVYAVNASGIADCLELTTGKEVWSERVRGGGPKSDSWSSSVLVGDRIYHLNQSGDCVVFRASPKFELLGANSLGNEMCNASLAVSQGDVFVRTHQHLWCIAETKKAASRQ
jgi:outer membrane protein assembly factor BamB